MCAHGEVEVVKIGDREVPVDRCLAPIVRALNDGGVQTAMCCCGHGEHDGFILLGRDEQYQLLVVVPSGRESLERFRKHYKPVAEMFDNRRKLWLAPR